MHFVLSTSGPPACCWKLPEADKAVVQLSRDTIWTATTSPEMVTCERCIDAMAAGVEEVLLESADPEHLRDKINEAVRKALSLQFSKGVQVPTREEVRTLIDDTIGKLLPGSQVTSMEAVSVHDEMIVDFNYKDPRPIQKIDITFTPDSQNKIFKLK